MIHRVFSIYRAPFACVPLDFRAWASACSPRKTDIQPFRWPFLIISMFQSWDSKNNFFSLKNLHLTLKLMRDATYPGLEWVVIRVVVIVNKQVGCFLSTQPLEFFRYATNAICFLVWRAHYLKHQNILDLIFLHEFWCDSYKENEGT